MAAAPAADDDWVHVTEEAESDSDESFFSFTDSMNYDDSEEDDDAAGPKDGGGGDGDTVPAARPTTPEPAPAAESRDVKTNVGETAAAAVAEEHGDGCQQGTDAEAYYYGGYSAGPLGYGYDGCQGTGAEAAYYGGYSAGPLDYDCGYYDYARDGYYGNGGDDYFVTFTTDAEAYYGLGSAGYYSDSYGSYGGGCDAYNYGGGYGDAYSYGGTPSSAYGYDPGGYVQDGGSAVYPAPAGYGDLYYAKPLEVRLRVPSWPPVFVDAAAPLPGGVPVYPPPCP